MDTLRAWWHTFEGWLHALLGWVESLALAPHAAWALFAVAFAESSVFPIPPDALLIPLCISEPSKAFWFATVCAAGSVLGGCFGYALGYFGGRPLVRRMFSEHKVRAVEAYYERYNAWATGIAGLTPLPYKVFTISAGAFAVNFKIFVLASLVSRSLRFFLVAGVAYLLGERARDFIDAHLGWLTVAFVILLIFGFWFLGKRAGRIGAESAT